MLTPWSDRGFPTSFFVSRLLYYRLKQEESIPLAELLAGSDLLYQEHDDTWRGWMEPWFAENSVVLIYAEGESRPLSCCYRDGLLEKQVLATRSRRSKGFGQLAASYWLESKDVPMVVLLGRAGVGKTYISLAHALEGMSQGIYNRVVLCKPLVAASRSPFLGTLPGDLHEKVGPFLSSFYDVAEALKMDNLLHNLIEDERILFEPLDFMRGRSFEDCLVVVDEAQNMTVEDMLLVTTRIGASSRAILLGDLNPMQRDIRRSSGLSVAMQSPDFHRSRLTATVYLAKRFRSSLTSLFEDIFSDHYEQSRRPDPASPPVVRLSTPYLQNP